MKLEIGGGTRDKARGDGWVNIDRCEGADIRHDLNVLPWPLDDESVDEVYSSHCLEHVNGPFDFFDEICRICRVDTEVEIRVPSPGSHLEFVWDHKHCFSPISALNMERYFPRDYWKKPKRLKLNRFIYHSSMLLEQIKRELPFLEAIDDELIMKYFPATAHEVCFFYTVIPNEHFH
jgi:hypothetical protein